VNVAPETCREKNEENKLDLLHLIGILFIKPRCTKTRNSKTVQHVLSILIPIISSSTTAAAAFGLLLERGDSSAVGRGRTSCNCLPDNMV
jgi:hypothetical protein